MKYWWGRNCRLVIPPGSRGAKNLFSLADVDLVLSHVP